MRLFICNIVPNKLVVELKAPQAANNFCFNLIRNNCFDYTFSIVPPSYNNPKIKSEDGIKYFHGTMYKKGLLGVLHYVYLNIKCAIEARKADRVWFYNICKANIICYIILRFLFGKRIYVILLDYTPNNRKSSLQYYLPYLYRKSFGVISLSERTTIHNKNMQYKAGIIESSQIKDIDDKLPARKLRFLFSGNLDIHTGFFLAVEVFKELPEWDLYISGNGNVNVNDFVAYPNIHYLGYLPYSEYLKLYDEVDICLSFRNPDYTENDNNFPSKILEYFSQGKVVLSTINYPELKDFHYFCCNYSKREIIKTINKIISLQNNELRHYRNNRKALLNNFSVESWREAFEKAENFKI